ncbi:MAG: HEAT repeat domain-containing protein, partial [Planctomycetota bacterium]
LAAALLLEGCAWLNRDNTPLLNLVEENLWPESTGSRLAVFPVVFPLGFVAITGDAFVVHPITVVGDAIEDTGDALWDDWDWDEQYVTECAAIPWRAVATPFVFTGDFLGRAMFDVPRRAEEERKEERKKEPETRKEDVARTEALARSLAEAKGLLRAGRASEALDSGLAIFARRGESRRARYYELLTEVKELILEAAHRSGRHQELLREDLLDEIDSLPGRLPEILASMQASSSPQVRWTVLRICSRGFTSARRGAQRRELLRSALGDSDPVIRYAALEVLASHYHSRAFRRLRADVERMSREDPDPVVKAFARRVLERSKE